MKLRGIERTPRTRIKAAEAVGTPDVQPVFKLEEFFTPDEWDKIDTVLMEAESNPELKSFWVKEIIDGIQALLILDPEKVERLRQHAEFKIKFEGLYAEELELDNGSVSDEEVLMANWLYPDLDQKTADWLKKEYWDDDIKQNHDATIFLVT